MQLTHLRLFHCSRPAGSTLNAGRSTRSAFTLIELILVVLVMLILMTLTVAVVGNMLDSDRVRGASRQIQNYLAGGRDRAIYSASRQEGGGIPPRVGVRFLSDPSLIVQVPNPADPTKTIDRYRGFNSMVFIQEVDPMPTSLRVWEDEDPKSSTYGQWKVSQFPPDADGGPGFPPFEEKTPIRGVGELIKRGLIESRIELVGGAPARVYYLELTFDDDPSQQTYYVRFFNDEVISSPENDPDNLMTYDDPADSMPPAVFLNSGILSRSYFNTSKKIWPNAPCHFRLLPAPMPNEEPRLLPDGVVIDVQSSLVGGAPRGITPTDFVDSDMTLQSQSRADGSFDILFNAQGVVDGPLAAQGLIHLVVADLEDLERGYYLSQTFDPNPDPAALNDEVIITGNAFVDSDTTTPGFDDSDGKDGPDERVNDVQIISLRTQTGSVYSSDIDPTIDADPASATFGRFVDPFRFAEIGGEAK